MNTQAEPICIVDGHHGIYAAQTFAQLFPEAIPCPEDREILETGPSHEWYWEAWDNVLGTASVCGEPIFQGESGDVFCGEPPADHWF